MADLAAQSELQCANCGGQRIYRPAHQGLECTQCGDVASLDTPYDHLAAEERDYAPDNDRKITLQAHNHHCETCGGDVVFTGPVLSERCAYCDGPVVLRPSDDAYGTMALIPFRVPDEQAWELVNKWVRRRLAAPNDLADIVAQGRVAGLYVPFWTFDSDEAIQYWAKYKVRRGKRTETRSTSGKMRFSFDDLLAPASHHITPLIRDGILHEFDPGRLRPYRPGYLAGFAAERHHQTVAEGLDDAKEDKDLLIRNRIKIHIGKRGVHDIKFRTDTSGIRYRRILMPVWMLHYTYRGEAMKVVVCGMQGRTFGERPFSYWKLAGYSALLSAAAMAVGLVWGGMAAP